jgi:hypothetical protein
MSPLGEEGRGPLAKGRRARFFQIIQAMKSREYPTSGPATGQLLARRFGKEMVNMARGLVIEKGGGCVGGGKLCGVLVGGSKGEARARRRQATLKYLLWATVSQIGVQFTSPLLHGICRVEDGSRLGPHHHDGLARLGLS